MISLDKKYKTRDGQEVKIYSVDGNCYGYIHGAVMLESGEWELRSWRKDGRFMASCQTMIDLVEVKERKIIEGWANICDNGTIGLLWDSKDSADAFRLAYGKQHKWFACVKVKIECEEGKGL
jgi:hypothetical protein